MRISLLKISVPLSQFVSQFMRPVAQLEKEMHLETNILSSFTTWHVGIAVRWNQELQVQKPRIIMAFSAIIIRTIVIEND